jgi:hypothetical protein
MTDLDNLTTGEADAWRCGFKEAQKAAMELARAYLLRSPPAIDAFADRLSSMQPPERASKP